METIKIHELINEETAIDIDKAIKVSETVIQKYKQSNSRIRIDFGGIENMLTRFLETLIIQLLKNGVDFEGTNFKKERYKETFDTIVDDLKTIGVDNIIELQVTE